MGRFQGSYKREELAYRTAGYGKAKERSNIGLANSPVVDKLLSLPGVSSSGALLELGCGDGNGTMYLAGRGYTVTGIDVSVSAAKAARARISDNGVRDVQIICCDATNLEPLQDDSFDVVVDSGCLHCVVDCDDRRKLLTAVNRVLKPNGSILGVSQCAPLLRVPDKKKHVIDGEILFSVDALSGERHPNRIYRSADAILAEIETAGLDVAWSEHRLFNKDWFSHLLHYHATPHTM